MLGLIKAMITIVVISISMMPIVAMAEHSDKQERDAYKEQMKFEREIDREARKYHEEMDREEWKHREEMAREN